MTSDKTKWRHVSLSEVVKPRPDNPVVFVLESYGIPYDRIYGQYCKGDIFTGKKMFQDYDVYIFGVSSDEELPHPQLAWHAEKEYACWQIQIYWKDYYGRIDAMWREEYDHYEVVTMWGSLGQLNRHTVAAMDKGMKLLLLVAERLSKAGRPEGIQFVTEENKWAALEKVIEIGRKVFRDTGELSQSAIARRMKGAYGISDRKSIYRLVTEHCQKDWRKEIVPLIKQP